MTDAPVTRPRLRDRLSIPATMPRRSLPISAITAVLFAVWNIAYPAVVRMIGPM